MLFWSCDEVTLDQDNPLDPGNSEYTPPTVTFVSGPSGETVNTSEVTFSWEGDDLVSDVGVECVLQKPTSPAS